MYPINGLIYSNISDMTGISSISNTTNTTSTSGISAYPKLNSFYSMDVVGSFHLASLFYALQDL